ncbi:MAG: alpha/beta hydrolase [Flavobacteriales bacterium]|nr:MAG: alpha/beta hydrolase [Flavobacteriales bacterium]
MTHHFIEYKAAKIHYTQSGKGEVLVLLHGFLEDSRMWTFVKKYLPSNLRIICVDLFGHGRSEGVGYIYSMDEMAEAVYAVLQNERIKRIHVAGHSMGGYVALALGEKYPDAIRSLILVHSTARADSTAKQADRDRAIALVKQDHRGFVSHAIPLLFSEKARTKPHKAIATLQKRALEIEPRSIAASLEGMKVRPDREVLLHFAPYPIAMISGKTDTVIPRDQSDEQMKAPNTYGYWLSTAHMGPWELPKKTAEIIKSFIDELKRRKKLEARSL